MRKCTVDGGDAYIQTLLQPQKEVLELLLTPYPVIAGVTTVAVVVIRIVSIRLKLLPLLLLLLLSLLLSQRAVL